MSAPKKKHYLLTTPSGRKWKRHLTYDEAAQLKQAGFTLEEIEEQERVPNRGDQRRQGLHLGKFRMPGRTASRKAKRRPTDE